MNASTNTTHQTEPTDDDYQQQCLQRWNQWVPMQDLYPPFQRFQILMLQKMDELLNEANITYWICGGVLLGAIRHGGLIPHDDDIDIECFAHDLDRLEQLPLDPPLFTGFTRQSGYWKHHPVAQLEFFHGLFHMDVFARPSPLPPGDPHFPSHEEVFPRTRYSIHNNLLTVWGPHRGKCQNYLDRCYGPDWKTTVCVYNHDFNYFHLANFHPRTEVLALEDYHRIVTTAGYHQPPTTGQDAQETWDQLQRDYDWNDFQERYQKYLFQRTIRRNRANAEYREQQQQQQLQDEQQQQQRKSLAESNYSSSAGT